MRSCYNDVNVRINQVKMARASFSGFFVAVEGPSDKKLYSKLLNDGVSKVLAIGDKEKVLQFLKILSRDSKVCGIVDNDYWPVTTQRPYELRALFVTDTHDAETLIIRSQAFHDLIAECCDEDALASFLAKRGVDDLRDVLVEEASKIGTLRLVNDLKGCYLRFNQLHFEDIVDKETLEIDIDALYDEIAEQSNVKVSRETLRTWVEQCHQADDADPWILATGHDMVGILSVALKKKLSKSASQHADIEGKLRISFNDRHFEGTRLCKDLRNWASTMGEKQFVKSGDNEPARSVQLNVS
jgi:hypothetical protein